MKIVTQHIDKLGRKLGPASLIIMLLVVVVSCQPKAGNNVDVKPTKNIPATSSIVDTNTKTPACCKGVPSRFKFSTHVKTDSNVHKAL